MKIAVSFLILGALASCVNTQTTNPAGCKLVDPNTLHCMSCDQQGLYYLAKGNCLRCGVKSCARIDASGSCVECEQGYYLRQGQICVVVSMIPGLNHRPNNNLS